MTKSIHPPLPAFNSAPWCLNGHFHTIFSSLLFEPAYVDVTRVKVETPDEDFLNLDLCINQPDSPIVILLHGLEGSSTRYYIRNLAHRLVHSGFSIAALNFRSCGGEMNTTRRIYHSGETEDLQTLCKWLDLHYPEAVQLAAGFSLGGSVLLNYLHKYPDKSLIKAFTAISVPYDLHRGSVNLRKGFNRIYDYQFLKSLEQKLIQKQSHFKDLPSFNGSTLYEFDDQVTGPLHGFKDAPDYYRSCSSAFFMDKITTPGLLIHSREDPLCPFDYLPLEDVMNNPWLTTRFPDRGGHVGFWSLPPGWLEQTVDHYFQGILAKNLSKNDLHPASLNDWASN